MTDVRALELWIGAVLAPEVRVAGTIASPTEVAPSRAYLERFPPALLTAFGRTPAGAGPLAELIERVRRQCAELGQPLPAAACDLEQGAGLHFSDATRLPPALALASAACAGPREQLDWIRAAGELVAREARARGVELVLAPVGDVNTERDNPIIAVRSFGDRPEPAAERAVAFAVGLRGGGAGACAKHFPGHGDTARDSHIALPSVSADLALLERRELPPFLRLIEHSVDAVMVAHLDVPALSGEPGCPSSLSAGVIEGALRGRLGFRGAVLSDAMNMGALARFEPRYVRALLAGCDVLLCPHDPLAAAEELLVAVRSGALPEARLQVAAERAGTLRERLRERPADAPRPFEDRCLADALAERALRSSIARWPFEAALPSRLAEPTPRTETPEVAQVLERLAIAVAGLGGGLELLPVLCEARAGRGRYGLTEAESRELAQRVEAARAAGRLPALLWFGSPQALPRALWEQSATPILLAFAPTPPLAAAAARWLAQLAQARGVAGAMRRLPADLG